MENQSDAPPTKRTRLLAAVAAAATCAQSAAHGAHTAAPGTDAANSATGPLLLPAQNTDDAPRDVRVQIEAFGSGAILHGGLDVPTDKTVGDLRELVLFSIRVLSCKDYQCKETVITAEKKSILHLKNGA